MCLIFLLSLFLQTSSQLRNEGIELEEKKQLLLCPTKAHPCAEGVVLAHCAIEKWWNHWEVAFGGWGEGLQITGDMPLKGIMEPPLFPLFSVPSHEMSILPCHVLPPCCTTLPNTQNQ
jgi:hypothetical protein